MKRNNGSSAPTVVALLIIEGFHRTLAQEGAAPPESDGDEALELRMPEALRLRHGAFHADFSRAT